MAGPDPKRTFDHRQASGRASQYARQQTLDVIRRIRPERPGLNSRAIVLKVWRINPIQLMRGAARPV
jgi:hypothetical protein